MKRLETSTEEIKYLKNMNHQLINALKINIIIIEFALQRAVSHTFINQLIEAKINSKELIKQSERGYK